MIAKLGLWQRILRALHLTQHGNFVDPGNHIEAYDPENFANRHGYNRDSGVVAIEGHTCV
jgi:hypothetical protein